MLRAPVTRLKRAVGAATCVQEPVRFAARELVGRRSTSDYRLRDGGLRATIRQPLLDAWVLEEVFRLGAYRFPAPVLQRLLGLGHPPHIVDLGGHVGLFVLWALRSLPDAHATSFEPDPANARALRRCIEVNGLGSRWNLVEAAAGTEDGHAQLQSGFHLSRLDADTSRLASENESLRRIFPFLSGTDLLSPTAATVQVRDPFDRLKKGDLLKIDIQGGEWDLLLDPRFEELTASALVLEAHPATCPRADARALVSERLARAGFVEVESRPTHGEEWVTWAVRPSP